MALPTKKILIVEDAPDLRELYSQLLKEEGYEVDTAPDGSAGLAKIKEGGWDLILLDIMLPVFDGFQIMTTIKDVPPTKPNGPVVFLTNLTGEDNKEQGLSKGAKFYWVKSELTPGDLIQKVKTLLIEYPNV